MEIKKEIYEDLGGIFRAINWKIGKSSIKFYKYPTWNCQLASLCCIQGFLYYASKEEILAIFQELIIEDRKTVLLDLEVNYMKYLSDIQDSSYLVKTKYENTTGSEMVLCIINVSKAVEDLTKAIPDEVK